MISWFLAIWLAIGIIKALLFITVLIYEDYEFKKNNPDRYRASLSWKEYLTLIFLVLINIVLGPIPFLPSIM